MPVALKLTGPNLKLVGPKVTYPDPFKNAGVLGMVSSGISAEDAYGANRPGTLGGGLTYATAMAMADATRGSAFGGMPKPLTIPLSAMYNTMPGALGPGAPKTPRTGSLELNLVNSNESIRMFAGTFFGQDRSLVGNTIPTSEGGPLDFAMGLMGALSTATGKILDYTLGIPRAFMFGSQQNAPVSRNADGSAQEPFQQDPAYQQFVWQATSDQLREASIVIAKKNVNDVVVGMYADKLYGIFMRDQAMMSGLSSGNERTDYLVKKGLQGQLALRKASAAAQADLNPFTVFALNWEGYTNTVGEILGSIFGFFPSATEAMAMASPVNAETEEVWQSLQPKDRLGMIQVASVKQVIGDVAATLPLFMGAGMVLSLARAAVAGTEFIPVVGYGSANGVFNMAKQAAWLVGKPLARTPAIFQEGGNIGRLLGTRFAMPQNIALVNLYDAGLYTMKLSLAEGLAEMGANWALSSLSPTYAAGLGRDVNNSHVISESQMAGAVNLIGMFSSGTLGAATLFKFTKGVGGAAASKVGMEGAPFNFAWQNHYGGAAMSNVVAKAFDLGGDSLAPFKNHIISEMQRWVQSGAISRASRARTPEAAAEILAKASITDAESVVKLSAIIKAADERSYGIETGKWTKQHQYDVKVKRELLNDIAKMMEEQNGPSYWARHFTTLVGPDGLPLPHTAASYRTYIVKTLNEYGKDGEAAAREIERTMGLKIGERAKLDPWRQAANGVRMTMFDHWNGVLQEIVKTGTSKTAYQLFIERSDHLFGEVALRFKNLVQKSRDGTATEADLAEIEAMRLEIVKTPEVGTWWANQKNWGGDGAARKVTDIKAETLADYIGTVEKHLPSRRPPPGASAEEGELNMLALRLEEGGQWTLAFKPTETTAIGAIKEAAEQSARELKTWEATRVTTHEAYADAVAMRGAHMLDLNEATRIKYIDPLAKRQAPIYEESRRLSDELTAANSDLYLAKPGTPHYDAAMKEVAELTAKVEAQTKLVEKAGAAMQRAEKRWQKAINADPELQRLYAAENAADVASRAAQDITKRPLGYSIGPVMPDGYTADFAAAMDWLVADRSGLDLSTVTTIQDRIFAARVLDPTAGNALYHATAHWAQVKVEGLIGKDTIIARGISPGGGGGNITDGVSFSYSRKVIDAWVSRMRGAADAVNGRMSFEQMLNYYRPLSKGGKLPETVTPLGREYYSRLESISDVTRYDPAFPSNTTMIDPNTGTWITPEAYREFLSKRLLEESHYDFYGDPHVLADTIRGKWGNDFGTPWNQWLTDNGPRPTEWAADGSLITKGRASPTEAQLWGGILETLEKMDPAAFDGPYPVYEVFKLLDQRLPPVPGAMVYLMDEADLLTGLMIPGAKFLGLTDADIGGIRVAVNPEALRSFDMAGGHRQPGRRSMFGMDPNEVRFNQYDVFVETPLDGMQPYDFPVEHLGQTWDGLGPTHLPVSYVTVRDPVTGELSYFKTPFLDYPMNKDLVDLGNRNLILSKFDSLAQGYKTWRLTEYMKGQAYRIFTERYAVAPEQVEALLSGVIRMGYEKWGPMGTQHFAMPLGYQAVAALRRDDVAKLAGEIFGRTRNDVTGEWTLVPLRNRATGEMEIPEYADMLVDGFRQAWTMNLTSGLTSKFYSLGLNIGTLAMLGGQWFIPLLRYQLSPIFKVSELWESAGFNLMRGTRRVSPEGVAAYGEMGMPTQVGQFVAELAGGDQIAAGLSGMLPTAKEAAALHPNGLADINVQGFGLVEELKAVSAKRAARSKAPEWLRTGYDNIANPSPFKDALANHLSIKLVRDDLPGLIEKHDPAGYALYHDKLKVPDAEMADFIVQDRTLYQGWQDGNVTWQQFEAHHTKFNSALKEVSTPELEAFYASEAWQTTEAMFRIGARTAQSEAFGVHYFGSYRSSLERALNHPLLAFYPISWAYKSAKEWFRFLYDNRTFGNGELRLGMTPAAYLQTTSNAQGIAWAQSNTTSLDEWMRTGPWGRAFFAFNLLMPGDWSNLPFPMSRSVRMILRGELNPSQHVVQNLFGPTMEGGLGAIRDVNLLRLGIADTYEFFTEGTPSQWESLKYDIGTTLNSDGTVYTPGDWDAITKYITVPLSPALLNEAPDR